MCHQKKRDKEADYEPDRGIELRGGALLKMEAMKVKCGWQNKGKDSE